MYVNLQATILKSAALSPAETFAHLLIPIKIHLYSSNRTKNYDSTDPTVKGNCNLRD